MRCRRCGCTDDDACITDEGPCWWVTSRLCCACEQAGDVVDGQRWGPRLLILEPK